MAQMSRRVEEQMRRASSKATERIARRYGDHFDMVIGCGFPKSGTVWLCRMLSTYLDAPFPRNYGLPIAMRAVVHAHWDYHPSLPPTAYIYRDGRDVMVSLFNHHMRQITTARHPRSAAKLLQRYREIFGPGFDPEAAKADVRPYLARFIEAEFRKPAYGDHSWPDHIEEWLGTPHDNVAGVSYEALKSDPVPALEDLLRRLLKKEPDPRLVEYAVGRNDFALATGRKAGEEDPNSPWRKGIVGDWRNHFTAESARVFDQRAGDCLVLLGYESDRTWVDSFTD